MNQEILDDANLIYDYLNVPTNFQKSDCIVGLGCVDLGIHQECVRLYQENYGNFLIFSGNVGKGTEGVLQITEAERFKNVAVEKGIPENKVLLEKEATNTYENYKYTKKLLKFINIPINSIIIVQKPYVKRRCIAIADIEFPEKRFLSLLKILILMNS